MLRIKQEIELTPNDTELDAPICIVLKAGS